MYATLLFYNMFFLLMLYTDLLQLNFIGVSVELDRHYIHFFSSKHMFAPVAVGEKTSPTQVSGNTVYIYQVHIIYVSSCYVCI